MMARVRDEKGRFVKGHTGNPNGRAPKERELRFYDITLSAVSDEDWRIIVYKARDQAKRGDAVARKWLADYLIGPPTQKTDLTVSDKKITIKLVGDDHD
jgi:hypothetical protein